MKVGIMQPYFFPYVGYFSLIKHTDKFILFDPVQFIRHGWIERNRILKPNEGWQYIQIALEKHSRTTLIKDIKINNAIDWKSKILSQLQHYKKRAPYYQEAISILSSIFSKDYSDIVSFNYESLSVICQYLGIETNIAIYSDMDIQLQDEVKAPDEWALYICKAMGNVTEYWNPIGGTSFFNREKYSKQDIALKFIDMDIKEYSQKRPIFEPGLSIIDVLMFNSKEEIAQMLDSYKLI